MERWFQVGVLVIGAAFASVKSYNDHFNWYWTKVMAQNEAAVAAEIHALRLKIPAVEVR
jgi:hypothetical protein